MLANRSGELVRLLESTKFAIYRTPVLNRLMAPKYPYKLNPGQLCAMLGFIDATLGSGAAIAEIGVAQGDTSVFLLEHLRTTHDERTLHLFDTFDGFTEVSIDHEVSVRGKSRVDFGAFRYGDEARFNSNLHRLGYTQFRTIKGDASEYDWPSLGPIGALLVDIDLYQPTLDILRAVYPQLVPGGGIVLDDCLPNTPWDGSLQAYEEFIRKHKLPFERVGRKGAVIRAG
jgi:O-methyltransferase